MSTLDCLLTLSAEAPGFDWAPSDEEREENLRLARGECARMLVLMRRIQERLINGT